MKSPIQRQLEIFSAALERPAGRERDAFLAQACAGDDALRQCVDALLAGHAQAGTFLASAAGPLGPTGTAIVPVTEKAGDKIGRYKLREKIGEGGCGVVYVAEQEEPVRRRVALKVIKLGMDTKSVVARFEAERQALAMMDHPNIARVLDAGATDTGRPYFVMELVRGIKITDYCDQNNLPTRERLDLFIKVCQAVQHAHQKGIIHRDLKPSNILVTLHDGVPVPKVIDFGIAKATEGRLTDATVYTELHQFIGTPAYMSPEQAEMSGLDIDTRSDIYSLGVLLYELLTGKTPFDARELWEAGLDAMRRTIREREPLRPSTRLETMVAAELTTTAKHRQSEPPKLINLLRGDLDWIVMKCLEKDRTRRYETANGVAGDLKRHLGNDPVLARPPSMAYRAQKFVRRNRFAVCSGVAVTLSLVLGMAASLWQAERAIRSEAAARRAQGKAMELAAQESQQRQRAEAAQALAAANANRAKEEAIRARRHQYAADMASTQHAIESGNLGRGRQTLRQYVPAAVEEDLRGFEWRYLWQLSQGQQVKTFAGHTGDVYAVAWSPDGETIAAGSSDHTITVWNAKTGDLRARLSGHTRTVAKVSFSPDGKLLASSGDDGQVHLWDLAKGSIVVTITNRLPRATFSPDGRLLAIGTGGNTWATRGQDVYLWESSSRSLVRKLSQAGDRAAFSLTGTRLASANGRRSVMLWDLASGRELSSLQNIRQVVSLAFAPDDKTLVIGTRWGEIHLWNTETDHTELVQERSAAFVTEFSLSPDGRLLAIGGGASHVIELWDLAARQRTGELRGHGSEVRAVAFSPDGKAIVSGSKDATAMLWRPEDMTAHLLITNVVVEPYRLAGHPKFSHDGRVFAFTDSHRNIRLWDTSTMRQINLLTNAGFPVAFARDNHTLLSHGRLLDALHRWDLHRSTPSEPITLSRNAQNRSADLFSAAPGIVIAGYTDGKIEVFDARAGNLRATFNVGINLRALDLAPDGRMLAVGGWSGKLELWDLPGQKKLLALTGHRHTVSGVAFARNGEFLASSSWDNTLKLWNPATGEELGTLEGHKAGVIRCAIAPDGKTIASTGDDGTIKLWHVSTRREVLSLPIDHTAMFLSFSPDGQILAAGSRHGIRLWQAPLGRTVDTPAEQRELKEVFPSGETPDQ